MNNLDTHGVLNVQGENFVFVSKAHPVIDLLRINKDILNAYRTRLIPAVYLIYLASQISVTHRCVVSQTRVCCVVCDSESLT